MEESNLPAKTSQPLETVDEQSLDKLFQMDPLQLTDNQVEAICQRLREQRKIWERDEKAGKRPKPVTKLDGDLSLEDLGL